MSFLICPLGVREDELESIRPISLGFSIISPGEAAKAGSRAVLLFATVITGSRGFTGVTAATTLKRTCLTGRPALGSGFSQGPGTTWALGPLLSSGVAAHMQLSVPRGVRLVDMAVWVDGWGQGGPGFPSRIRTVARCVVAHQCSHVTSREREDTFCVHANVPTPLRCRGMCCCDRSGSSQEIT